MSATAREGAVAVLIDARGIDPGTTFEADVCVLGAGAAGITLARALPSRFGVLVVESGGFDLEEETQELYRGEESGDLLSPTSEYLTRGRLRYFGGTTNHWAGWCRPLDPVDFQERPWIPDSGWPFGRDALDPWYRRAAEVVEISPFGDDAAPFPRSADGLSAGSDWFEDRYFHLSPPTRFGVKYREEIVGSDHVRLLLRANAVALRLRPGGRKLDRVELATLDGRTATVRARATVLALGGIENARLLLLSDDVQPAGVGNDHDLVGRYFMDQPHLVGARGTLEPGKLDLARHQRFRPDGLAHRVLAVLAPTTALQERERLLNIGIQLRPQRTDPDPLLPGVRELRAALEADDTGPADETSWNFYLRAEAAPVRESRVTLGDDLDALGQRRTRLEWRVRPEDREILRRTTELLARDLGRRGLGRLRIPRDEPRLWRGANGGFHLLGTTRMHADPRRGVTDPDGRVHGIEDLWVAGSSLFPTYGYANPTLTIVALALRLAHTLEGRLS